MKKVAGVILLFVSISSWAQRDIDDNTGWTIKDRIYTGGGMGLNTGTDGFGGRYHQLSVNPILGYMVTPKFSVGTGVAWQLFMQTQPINKSMNQYVVNPFVRYNFDQLFAYGEYNLINTPLSFNSDERRNFDRLLLGLGYSQPIGSRSKLNVMALYDVIYDVQEVFPSPWVFRVFVTL